MISCREAVRCARVYRSMHMPAQPPSLPPTWTIPSPERYQMPRQSVNWSLYVITPDPSTCCTGHDLGHAGACCTRTTRFPLILHLRPTLMAACTPDFVIPLLGKEYHSPSPHRQKLPPVASQPAIRNLTSHIQGSLSSVYLESLIFIFLYIFFWSLRMGDGMYQVEGCPSLHVTLHKQTALAPSSNPNPAGIRSDG